MVLMSILTSTFIIHYLPVHNLDIHNLDMSIFITSKMIQLMNIEKSQIPNIMMNYKSKNKFHLLHILFGLIILCNTADANMLYILYDFSM